MSIDGKWNIVVDTPMGAQESEVDFKSDGDTLTGSAEVYGQQINIYDGTVDGDSASWKVDITSPMPMTIAFTAEVEGDSLSGQAEAGMFPSASVTGSRI